MFDTYIKFKPWIMFCIIITLIFSISIFCYHDAKAENTIEEISYLYYPETEEGYGNPLNKDGFMDGDSSVPVKSAGYKYSTDRNSYYSGGSDHYNAYYYYTWIGYSEHFDAEYVKYIRLPYTETQYDYNQATICFADGTEEVMSKDSNVYTMPEGKSGDTYIKLTAKHVAIGTSKYGYKNESDCTVYQYGYIRPVRITYERPQTPCFSGFQAPSDLTVIITYS